MRLLRLLVVGAAMAAAAVLAAGTYVLYNQTRLVELVLAQISERTGLKIVISSAHLSFHSHLIVILEKPRVLKHDREVARLRQIRAVLSYHALVHRNGLPLYELSLYQGKVRVPEQMVVPSGARPSPRLDQQTINGLKQYLESANDIAQWVEFVDTVVSRSDGTTLIDHLDVIAHRQRRRRDNSPWLLRFDAGWDRGMLSGLHLTGDLLLGSRPRRPGTIATGRLWFWGLSLNGVEVAGTQGWGQAQGNLRLLLDGNGGLGGNCLIDVRNLAAAGGPLNTKLNLGDYSFRTPYRFSAESLELDHFSLSRVQVQVLTGRFTVTRPYGPTRSAALTLRGLKLALAQSNAWLRVFRGVPPAVAKSLARLRSGDLIFDEVSLDSAEPIGAWTATYLRDRIHAAATLSHASYLPSPDSKIPRVSDLDARLVYSHGALRFVQGTAEIGDSRVSSFSIDADLRGAPREIGYKLRANADVDLEELYTAAQDSLYRAEPQLRGRLKWVHGHSAVVAKASGTLIDCDWSMPPNYEVGVAMAGVQFLPNTAPSAIALQGGSVRLTPGRLELARVVGSPTIADDSTVTVNGTVSIGVRLAFLNNVTVELAKIRAEQWLPLLTETDQLSASGSIAGKLVAEGDIGQGVAPRLTGRLTLGPGEVRFGFLRSAMAVQSATLTLDGRGLLLAMPGCRFENETLDFSLTVPELAHPVLRIDATAANVDFESMRFIRLPWSPKRPPHFFEVSVAGHIEAKQARFAKLAMANVTADFSRDSTDWRVSNFLADSSGGRVGLEISGRARDEWIHVKASLSNIDAAQLIMMTGQYQRSPLSGRLNAEADLWANTDIDFFDTLAGTISMRVNDGTLDRFTLLTRILSLIDLKNWLTARFPDPRQHGVPFNTLTADFKGRQADFYTDNLRMQGPVMDIFASGDVELGPGRINMEIGLIPFNTANWILSKIPVVGENLSGGSSEVLAAYFQARGPISNPTVMPKPITSVKEFVIKTLGLPINIISPNTIK